MFRLWYAAYRLNVEFIENWKNGPYGGVTQSSGHWGHARQLHYSDAWKLNQKNWGVNIEGPKRTTACSLSLK